MSDSAHFDLTQLTARPAHLEEITLLAVNQESSSLKIRYNILNLSIRPMISYYGCRAKKHLCDREDYGSDLEECIEIIDQFSQVLHELACAGERVSVIQKLHVIIL